MISSCYFNYGAESIILNGLQRVNNQLPYLSLPNQFPLALTAYGPLIIWLISPFTFFYNSENILAIGNSARLIILSIILFQYYFLYKNSSDNRKAIPLLFFLYISFLPLDLLAIKPDPLSFLLELMGFICFQKFLNNQKTSDILKTTFFLAFAFLTKFNTVGVAIGLGLYLLQNKKIKDLLIYSLTFIFFSSLGGLILYYAYGDKLILNLLPSTKSYFDFSTQHIISVIISILKYATLPLGILIYFSFKSYKSGILKNRNSYLYPILISLPLAFLGQFKVAAFLNYFLGSFLILILFAAPSFENFIKDLKFKRNYIIIITLLFSYHFIMATASTGNYILNYPWKEVQNYIKSQNIQGKIYIQDDNAKLYFYRYNIIGSWSESILEISPLHKENTLALKEQINTTNTFEKLIVVGSNCSSWTPSGIFKDNISELNKLEKKFKKICLYVRP